MHLYACLPSNMVPAQMSRSLACLKLVFLHHHHPSLLCLKLLWGFISKASDFFFEIKFLLVALTWQLLSVPEW